MRLDSGGHALHYIPEDVRCLLGPEFEGDLESACFELKQIAKFIDMMGCILGEEDQRKGTFRNVAMTIHSRSNMALMQHFKSRAHDVYQCTGVRVDWKVIRDLGEKEAYRRAVAGRDRRRGWGEESPGGCDGDGSGHRGDGGVGDVPSW